MHVVNPNTEKRKGLITYYTTYGITTLKNMWIMIMQQLFKKMREK
jgi:hypothetical protein